MPHGFITHFNNYRVAAAGGSAPIVSQQAASNSTGQCCGCSTNLSFSSTPPNGSLIILVINDNTGGGIPAGFTAITGGVGACTVCWKIAASETNSYQLDYNGASFADYQMITGLVITGNKTTTPIDVSANTANSRTTPSVTTTKSLELVLTIGGSQGNNTDYITKPTSYTAVRSDTTGFSVIGIGKQTVNAAGTVASDTWNTGSYVTSKVFTIGVLSSSSV